MGLSSLFIVYATAAPGVSARELEERLMSALEQALKSPASADEFERALNGWQKMFYHRVEGVMSRAHMLSGYYHQLGEAKGFERDLKRYTQLTPERVFEATQRLIHDHPLRLRFVPQESAEAIKPPQRDALPALAKAQPWSPPEVNTWTTPQGLNVWHVEQRQAPLVSLELRLPHGANTDPASRAGLSALMVDLLDEGAGELSALELSDAMQRLATDYSAGVSDNHTSFHLNALAHQLTPSLTLLSDIITRPHLKEADLERLRAQRVAQAISREADPRGTRNLLMSRVLYGEGAEGLPASGFADTLKAITLDEIKARHAALVRPQGATLVVVGAVDRPTLETALNATLASWTGAPTVSSRPLTPQAGPTRVHWVDFSGSTQSAIAPRARRAWRSRGEKPCE